MTVHTMKADCAPLARAVGNALLFASKDGMLTAICSVNFVSDGSALDLQATDRFRGSIETVDGVDVDGDTPFSFLLSRESVTALQRALKAVKVGRALVSYDSDAGTVRVECGDTASTYRTLEGAFPKIAPLFPTGEPVGTGRIGFNPKFLADLGKVQCEERNATVTILTFGETKPVLANFRGGPRVLLMPTRLRS